MRLYGEIAIALMLVVISAAVVVLSIWAAGYWSYHVLRWWLPAWVALPLACGVGFIALYVWKLAFDCWDMRDVETI